MSDNCRIGYVLEDQPFIVATGPKKRFGATIARAIYCHRGGWLGAVGAMLVEHYQDIDKVEALIELGSISQLGVRVAPDPGEEHPFENPADGVTIAYRRDRGEQYAFSNQPLQVPVHDLYSLSPALFLFQKLGGKWEWVNRYNESVAQLLEWEKLKTAFEPVDGLFQVPGGKSTWRGKLLNGNKP